MAGWGIRVGLVFPVADAHPGRTRGQPASAEARKHRRADYVRDAFRRAWTAAKVPPEKWDAPDEDAGLAGERAHGSPCHAIRRCMRTELIRAGVEEAIALYAVGHAQGLTAAAYVPEDHPEESPYWPRLRQAIDSIPRVGTSKPVHLREVG
jgi:hypothetical protein